MTKLKQNSGDFRNQRQIDWIDVGRRRRGILDEIEGRLLREPATRALEFFALVRIVVEDFLQALAKWLDDPAAVLQVDPAEKAAAVRDVN